MSVLVISGAEGRPAPPQTELPDPVTIEHGGTNSTTALNNHRVMVSASGAIAELAAGTAGQVLTSGGAGVAPSWQSPSGGLASPAALWWSPVDRFGRVGSPIHRTGGATDYTVGTSFAVHQSNVRVTGARLRWAGSAGLTLKLSIWDPNGVLATSEAVTSPAAGGVVSVTWDSPITPTLGKPYVLGYYQTNANGYAVYSGDTEQPSVVFLGGPAFTWVNLALYAAGDQLPASAEPTEKYPIEPTLEEVP